jgi:hypothetical protein
MMPLTHRDHQAGFVRLEEVMLVLAVWIILAGMVLAILFTGFRHTAWITAKADLQTRTTQAMEEILRDIRDACAIDATHGAYSTSAQTLILRVPSVYPAAHALSGQVIDRNTAFDEIIYTLTTDAIGPTLQRIVDANSQSRRATENGIVRTVSRRVADLVFTRLTISGVSDAEIRVRIVGQERHLGVTHTITMESAGVMRGSL